MTHLMMQITKNRFLWPHVVFNLTMEWPPRVDVHPKTVDISNITSSQHVRDSSTHSLFRRSLLRACDPALQGNRTLGNALSLTPFPRRAPSIASRKAPRRWSNTRCSNAWHNYWLTLMSAWLYDLRRLRPSLVVRQGLPIWPLQLCFPR